MNEKAKPFFVLPAISGLDEYKVDHEFYFLCRTTRTTRQGRRDYVHLKCEDVKGGRDESDWTVYFGMVPRWACWPSTNLQSVTLSLIFSPHSGVGWCYRYVSSGTQTAAIFFFSLWNRFQSFSTGACANETVVFFLRWRLVVLLSLWFANALSGLSNVSLRERGLALFISLFLSLSLTLAHS